MKAPIYLDYAAATPLDPAVFKAMLPYFSEKFYNPSSIYEPARQVKREINTARENVARIIGAKPTEIIFTAGATESINLAFSGFKKIAHSEIEHDAIYSSASGRALFLPVDENGNVKIDMLTKLITDDVEIISIGLINNEIGTIQNLKDISSIVADIRKKRSPDSPHLWLHTDASQAPGIVDINVGRIGVDMMTLNGSKIYGPKQTAILWARSEVNLSPIIYGGGQERALRSGTENVGGIIGFSKALELSEKYRHKEVKRFYEFREFAKKTLQKSFPNCVISGHSKYIASHILHVSFPGVDAERLVFACEAKGVLIATGAACAANQMKSSHVLKAIGLSESEARGSIRLSFGRTLDKQSLEKALDIIIDSVKSEKKYG